MLCVIFKLFTEFMITRGYALSRKKSEHQMRIYWKRHSFRSEEKKRGVAGHAGVCNITSRRWIWLYFIMIHRRRCNIDGPGPKYAQPFAQHCPSNTRTMEHTRHRGASDDNHPSAPCRRFVDCILTESTTSKMPSTMLRILSTSPPKSACPGVSTKLYLVPLYFMAQF